MTLPGAARLDRALAKLETEAVNADTVKGGAEIVERQAKRNSRSRRVRRTARISATGGRAVLQFGSRAVPWTGPSHFGHGSPGRPRAQGGWMPKNPFLYDAVDEKHEKVVDMFADDLNDAIRRVGL